jgi:hypothetical protein
MSKPSFVGLHNAQGRNLFFILLGFAIYDLGKCDVEHGVPPPQLFVPRYYRSVSSAVMGLQPVHSQRTP